MKLWLDHSKYRVVQKSEVTAFKGSHLQNVWTNLRDFWYISTLFNSSVFQMTRKLSLMWSLPRNSFDAVVVNGFIDAGLCVVFGSVAKLEVSEGVRALDRKSACEVGRNYATFQHCFVLNSCYLYSISNKFIIRVALPRDKINSQDFYLQNLARPLRVNFECPNLLNTWTNLRNFGMIQRRDILNMPVTSFSSTA